MLQGRKKNNGGNPAPSGRPAKGFFSRLVWGSTRERSPVVPHEFRRRRPRPERHPSRPPFRTAEARESREKRGIRRTPRLPPTGRKTPTPRLFFVPPPARPNPPSAPEYCPPIPALGASGFSVPGAAFPPCPPFCLLGPHSPGAPRARFLEMTSRGRPHQLNRVFFGVCRQFCQRVKSQTRPLLARSPWMDGENALPPKSGRPRPPFACRTQGAPASPFLRRPRRTRPVGKITPRGIFRFFF